MSAITMCDFCGTLGGTPAAQVAFRLKNHTLEYARLTNNERYLDHTTDSIVKDACHPCLEKLLVQPTLAIGGYPFKEEDDSPA